MSISYTRRLISIIDLPYDILYTHIQQKRVTDMDFWARTDGLQRALRIPEDSSTWYCSFYFHGEQEDLF
jgi:hypothetical protein